MKEHWSSIWNNIELWKNSGAKENNNGDRQECGKRKHTDACYQQLGRKEEEACVLQLKHMLNVHLNECGVFAKKQIVKTLPAYLWGFSRGSKSCEF